MLEACDEFLYLACPSKDTCENNKWNKTVGRVFLQLRQEGVFSIESWYNPYPSWV
jgi:hypothetical protein